jgi:hypothetical protein
MKRKLNKITSVIDSLEDQVIEYLMKIKARRSVSQFHEIRGESEAPSKDAHPQFSRNRAAQSRRVLQLKLWELTFTSVTKPRVIKPPINAEYLLYLLLKRDEREYVIGDLIEDYYEVLNRFNKKWRADLYFYKEVMRSIGPLFWRALLRISTLVWLGRILRRLIS